jgi:hypothetical protein
VTTPVDEMSDDVRITILLCISLIAVLTLLLAATSGPIPMGVVLGLGGLAVAPAVAAYTTLANSAVLADVRGEGEHLAGHDSRGYASAGFMDRRSPGRRLSWLAGGFRCRRRGHGDLVGLAPPASTRRSAQKS